MNTKFQRMPLQKLSFLFLLIILLSCHRNNSTIKQNISDANTPNFLKYAEDQEDSTEITIALVAQSKFKNIVYPDNETQPVESINGEDAADDPAIWVNKKDPSKSLILGTNKKGGIYVYNLNGTILQYKKIGRINNVDLRDGFNYDNKEVVLVAGSNRSTNCISILYITKETGMLSDTILNIKSTVDEVYGICLYHSQINGAFYVFVNGKGGQVEQWELVNDENLQANLINQFALPNQPEGMIANDRTGVLYLGVEDLAIYKVNIESEDSINPIILPESDSTNSNISYDIEGLALFSHNGKDYLIASSQGNFSYAIFELGNPEKYITSFVIAQGDILDGVEETDGLEVNTTFLSNKYPHGILVVQDGYNFNGDTLINQNFKIVSFDKVLKLL